MKTNAKWMSYDPESDTMVESTNNFLFALWDYNLTLSALDDLYEETKDRKYLIFKGWAEDMGVCPIMKGNYDVK